MSGKGLLAVATLGWSVFGGRQRHFIPSSRPSDSMTQSGALGMRWPTFANLSMARHAPRSCRETPYRSQLGEDRFLAKYFFRDETWRCFHGGGRCSHASPSYLELGAHDGSEFSNTHYFANRLGWDGLLIEAVPGSCAKLKRNRPEAVVACGAVCDEVGHITFMVSGAISGAKKMGMSQEHLDAWSRGQHRFHSMRVPCAPLADILRVAGFTFVDFLSLDVEEQESAVLETVNFSAFAFGVALIELADKSKALKVRERFAGDDRARAILRDQGYRFVQRVRLNELWVNPNVTWAVAGAERVLADPEAAQVSHSRLRSEVPC